MKNILVASTMLFACVACNSKGKDVQKNAPKGEIMVMDTTAAVTDDSLRGVVDDAATILARKEVPILCYHHIKSLTGREGSNTKTYSVTPEGFADQMKLLSESGYHSVLPDQLYNYLAYGAELPNKPVMITFDDTDGEQYSIGAEEMKKYGFKGVFFIMTIAINKPRYMTKDQIKELSDNGHVIAGHTWDHHSVNKYSDDDWEKQLEKPRKTLEEITGKPIEYFAYPFGSWNQTAITEIKERDYKLAFILSTKRDTIMPLFTVRRMIVPSAWSSSGMLLAMNSTFHL